MAELSSCDRDLLARKTEDTYYEALHMKSWLAATFKESWQDENSVYMCECMIFQVRAAWWMVNMVDKIMALSKMFKSLCLEPVIMLAFELGD